jgi:ubiquinone/menaquinone biosynthesis C-methylase UbiE
METTVRRFDRRASTYETSALQPFLFGPVQHTALQLARQHLPQARRILDVGCGTGQLLRRARPCYPLASLIGIDLAGQMLATANALTPEKLSVDFIRAQAEQLPFPDAVFDLVLTTLSLRHWTDPPAGIAEIGRVLTVDGALILADVFPRHPHPVRLLHAAPTPRPDPNRPRQDAGPSPPGRCRLQSHPLVPLPDVQVIAVRKTTTTRRPRSASSARRWTRGQR